MTKKIMRKIKRDQVPKDRRTIGSNWVIKRKNMVDKWQEYVFSAIS